MHLCRSDQHPRSPPHVETVAAEVRRHGPDGVALERALQLVRRSLLIVAGSRLFVFFVLVLVLVVLALVVFGVDAAVAVAVVIRQRKDEKVAEARAEPHTVPRQKTRPLMKTAKAMKPEKKKMTLMASTARAAMGLAALGKNLWEPSREAIERMDKTAEKIWKLICDGDSVRVSKWYQLATYPDNPITMMENTA